MNNHSLRILWLLAMLLFIFPIMAIINRMVDEVNAGSGSRQFERGYFAWSRPRGRVSQIRKLWKQHQECCPNSKLRMYLATCYVMLLAYVIGLFIFFQN
jgi:hypothetical protein